MSKRLLLFDFDETYFKHNTNEEDLSHNSGFSKLWICRAEIYLKQ
ncbi:hydrolase [Staphylococcus schweitzeri]|nr:hydrolase [Staphylococcus schweitzeri]